MKRMINWFFGLFGSKPEPQKKSMTKRRTTPLRPGVFDLEMAVTHQVKNFFDATDGHGPRKLLAKELHNVINRVHNVTQCYYFSNRSHTGIRFRYQNIKYEVNIRADMTVNVQMRKIKGGIPNIDITYNQGAYCNKIDTKLKITKTYVTFHRPLTLKEFGDWLRLANQ